MISNKLSLIFSEIYNFRRESPKKSKNNLKSDQKHRF